jgi:hypothetical protein
MPEYQPVSTTYLAAIQRPGCPNCQQRRMLLSRLAPGPSGFDTATFECQKCGRLDTTMVARDPRTSTLWGWLAADLWRPT